MGLLFYFQPDSYIGLLMQNTDLAILRKMREHDFDMYDKILN